MGRYYCTGCHKEGLAGSSDCPRDGKGCKGPSHDYTCSKCLERRQCCVCNVEGCRDCIKNHKCKCLSVDGGKKKDSVRCQKFVCSKDCAQDLFDVSFACGHLECVVATDTENEMPETSPEDCSSCSELTACTEEYRRLRQDAKSLQDFNEWQVRSQTVTRVLETVSKWLQALPQQASEEDMRTLGNPDTAVDKLVKALSEKGKLGTRAKRAREEVDSSDSEESSD